MGTHRNNAPELALVLNEPQREPGLVNALSDRGAVCQSRGRPQPLRLCLYGEVFKLFLIQTNCSKMSRTI